jgi:NADH dehydrogenase
MTEEVVVLGSGYAGTGAIQSLEDELDGEANLIWVSETDYHLVLHESHRCISDPSVQDQIVFPVEEIKSPRTEFRQGSVTDIDTEQRLVRLESGDEIGYDYLLVGIGSGTAFFGIPGLEEHAHTLKGLDDVLEIHDHLQDVAREATRTDPAQVVVGGAGLSGIQTAGEVAKFRDEHSAPIEISLIEGLDEIFPGNDSAIQRALRTRLESRDVDILTGEFVSEVDDDRIYVGEDRQMPYDVLVWTGGITGRAAVRDTDIRKDEQTNRLETGQNFQTGDERVFAVGDSALIDQPADEPAPPTAQAAWQAAEVAGENIARAIRGQPLKDWQYKDKGTVVSVGEDAVAQDIFVVPFVDTFGGFPARTLKKGIAARWIADIAGYRKAAAAWPDM